MIGNHSIGSYPSGSTVAYSDFLRRIEAVPDIVVTRSGGSIFIDITNFEGREAVLFRSGDIRGLFTELVTVVAQYEDTTIDAGENYKYKAQFVRDYQVGAIQIRVKGAKSAPGYSVSETRKL